MNVAIVEDDPHLAELIKLLLTDSSESIDHYTNGWQAIDGIKAKAYDIILLDVMLPGVNGMEVCRQLRAHQVSTPILMLTAKSQEADKVQGLELGADDYLTKPFSNMELKARVKALLRRSQGNKKEQIKADEAIQIGQITINPAARSVTVSNQEVDLTPKEFELLYLFMANPGRSFSRGELLERVWGEHFEGLDHTVNSNINRLRMKIEQNPATPTYLLTLWGVGYKFVKSA